MTTRRIDNATLSSLSGSVDAALAALQPLWPCADSQQLAAAQVLLQRVRAACSLLELAAGTALCDRLLAVLAHAGEAPAMPWAEALAALASLFDAASAGEPPPGLAVQHLWPLAKRLEAVAGAVESTALDWFFPPLNVVAQPDPEAGQEDYRQARTLFQKGLLAWLQKSDRAGAQQMAAALGSVAAGQRHPEHCAYWQALQGGMLTLVDAGQAATAAQRQWCSRVDVQLRRLVEGHAERAERLMREALLWVAQAPQGAAEEACTHLPLLSALRQRHRLVSMATAAPGADQTADAAAGLVAQLECRWQRIAIGAAGAWPEFQLGLARLCACSGTAATDRRRLLQALQATTQWLAEEPARLSQGAAVDVACGLALLNHRDAALMPLVDAMVPRLHARFMPPTDSDEVALPALAPAHGSGDILADHWAAAEHRVVSGQLARQIGQHLALLEQLLDNWFRSPELPLSRADCDAPLTAMSGLLSRLGQFAALGHLRRCMARLEHLAASQPGPEACTALAEEFAMLGLFVDALALEPTDFNAFVQQLGSTPGAPMPATVEQRLADQQQAGASLAEQLRATPEDPALRDSLRTTLECLAQDADLVDDAALGEQAKQALDVLAAGDTPQLGAPPAIPAPPAASSVLLAQAAPEARDQELLAIFLEEAQGVLAEFADQLIRLAGDPQDMLALTALRRATHTLKGSGRMVGLDDLADTAWAVEQTLNLWLRRETPASPQLIDLLQLEHRVFAQWLRYYNDRYQIPPDPGALVALAEQLRGQEPLPLEIPALQPAGEAVVVDGPPPTEMPAPLLDDPHLDAAAEALDDLLGGCAPEPRLPAHGPSAALMEIFQAEARQHLDTLRSGIAELCAQPQQITGFPLTRAAHTLGGIAATVGLLPINHLAIALEHALLRRDGSPVGAEATPLSLLQQAVAALETMYNGLGEGGPLEEAETLISALDASFPAAPPLTCPACGPAAEPLEAPTSLNDLQAETLPALADELDAQLFPLFCSEAEELLPALAEQLALWQQGKGDVAQPALARLLHTFKGAARMAGAMNLGEMTHALESRLLAATPDELAGSELREVIEQGCDALQADLAALQAADPAAGPSDAAPAVPPETSSGQPMLRVRAEVIDQLVNESGELSIARSRIEGEVRSLKTALLDLTDNVQRLRSQLREIEIQAESQMQAQFAATLATTPAGETLFDPLELDRFTRFQELTRFMAESVGDVSTVQHQLLRHLDDANSALLAQARLNRSLQQGLMQVRMLPFQSLADRLHRVVRQTAKEVGKRASLDIHGAGVELDRSVLEKMQAPLEHMLRNAVIHGLEPPTQRSAAGKAEIGKISLSLNQEGNTIWLELRDDGGGLDWEAIARRAAELGLLDSPTTATPEALSACIFAPGFSTAEHLTVHAGRGIGMDVVKNTVDALGGQIHIDSQAGLGCQFRISLPLTLAVTQTVLVQAGDAQYAIPAPLVEQVRELNVGELTDLRLSGEARWQEQSYPLAYLPGLLGHPETIPETHRQYSVLLLRSGAQRLALQVDAVLGHPEAVVKNIGQQLAGVPGLVGATVLGDGQVVLIINPVTLAQRSAQLPKPAAPQGQAPGPTSILVVDDSLTVRKFTQRLLSRAGYAVILAKDGQEALEHLALGPVDLVITDIEMPRMDGFTLIEQLRQDAALAGLPIIVITSRTADKHRQHALRLGADHYLGKPYDEDALLALIKALPARS